MGERRAGVMAKPHQGLAATRSVLVVEDDDHVRESICEELLDRGFQVGAAENGAQAFGMMLAERFDAVVLDLIMPGMSGMAILEELARQGRRLPILLISGYPELLRKVRYDGLGAMALLEKPFQMDDLITAVEGLIGPDDRTGNADDE
jgi:DNA-binding response OmpR family regulator